MLQFRKEKKTFKRVVTILLSLCMCFSTAFASGATTDSAEQISSNSSAATRTDWLTGECGTTFIEVNSVKMEIPVIRNIPSPVTTSGGATTVTETIFVPDMTEEALERNRQIVSEIKTYGAPAARGYGTIPYGQLQSIPSSWVPVSPYEHHIGVHYTVYIDFLSSFGQSDYTLYYTHQAV